MQACSKPLLLLLLLLVLVLRVLVLLLLCILLTQLVLILPCLCVYAMQQAYATNPCWYYCNMVWHRCVVCGS